MTTSTPPSFAKLFNFTKKLWMVGFGCIASGTLPLIFRHLEIKPEQIEAFSSLPDRTGCAEEYGIKLNIVSITPENFRELLNVQDGDFLLNLSTDISSLDMMQLCDERNCTYLDTCTEPWPGGYFEGSISSRSNYSLREKVVKIKNTWRTDGKRHPTMISCFGANPGLVSCLTKQALMNVAKDTGVVVETVPKTREEWSKLSMALGIKVIHIAERDTQVTDKPKKRLEFVNTWSCYGFLSEGTQPTELGWGTHEKELPYDGHVHEFGCGSAIYLDRPGIFTKVRTWTPTEGPFHGFLITHNEAISIADYLSVKDENGVTIYRPTVHYAYHPCDSAIISLHEYGGKNYDYSNLKMRVLMDDIIDGMDELGVLLCGHAKNTYWFGSQLTIQQSRELAPHVSATSLQVCASVLSAMILALNNPGQGILEADDVDFQKILEVASPYLGPVVGEYSDWTPLKGRYNMGFTEEMDEEDVWQFKNVRVF